MQASAGSTITSSAQIAPGSVLGSDIANDTVLDANIGAHTTSKITVPTSLVSGTLATSNFADNTVAVGRLATGTKGNLFIQGVSGIAKLLGVGSNGQSLVADSTNADGVKWAASSENPVVWISATALNLPGLGTHTRDNGIPIISATDNVDCNFDMNVKVPQGATSLTSVKILYKRGSTGNIFANGNSSHFTTANPNTVQTDSTGNIAYSGVSADGQVGTITVDSTMFDGLTGLVGGDIITLSFGRVGGNASDTYNADWLVYGFLWTFA